MKINRCLKLLQATMLLTCLVVLSHAQEEPAPTPVGIISMQGTGNIGEVQLLSLADVLNRTNLISWQEADLTGRGQRIGILDQGFGGLADFETDTRKIVNLPPDAKFDAISSSPITHGIDVMYIIETIAPDVDLFACEYFSFDVFVICIDWMLSENVNIINHSAGVPVLPLDGTGQWAREVDRAARSDVLWINAAGNYADGYIADFFSDRNTNTYHEFRGQGVIEALAVEPIGSFTGRVMLSWESANDTPSNAIDLDLEAIDENNNIIASSSRPQNGKLGEDAIEVMTVDMSQAFGIRIRDSSANAELVEFVLFIEFASLQGGVSRESIISPGDSLYAITVGALQGSQIAPYSSQGPITTGAIKPNIVAPGELILPNEEIFVGTSAAAPILAGSAALVWELHPDWSRQQVFDFLLEAVQDDREIPGLDPVYGSGRLFMPSMENTSSPPTPLPIIPPTEIPVVPPPFTGPITANSQWIPTIQNIDGIQMALVPAGCILVGSTDAEIDAALNQCNAEIGNCDRSWFAKEGPAQQICFNQPFWIAQTETTNSQYGSQGNFSGNDFPRDTVSWQEAYNFCQSRGGRLPTEAEWEYAASGPSNWVYPWGNQLIPSYMVHNDGMTNQPSRVNSIPQNASWVGAVDMAGNLREWTSSIFRENDFPYNPLDGRENPLDSQAFRVIKGGSWITPPVTARTSDRAGIDPNTRDWNVGFRCVRDYE